MAREIPGFSHSLVSADDLTDSQFCGVDMGRGGDGGKVVLPSAGGRCIGIIQNKPDVDQVATVVTSGVSKVLVGATGIKAGDNVTVDSDGTIIQASPGDTPIGVAEATNAAGELGTVLLLISASNFATS